jgi:uncharacterized tellurite resistance protein B-like protein
MGLDMMTIEDRLEERRMLLRLKQMLLREGPAAPGSEEKDHQERIQIATCVILLEVAKSDDEFSPVEKTTLSAILKKQFDLPDEAIQQLLQIAQKNREESVDLWEFTNLINENYSREERKEILEAAWMVIYADDKLDMYEDHFVHKLAKLLRFEHRDLIAAKLRVKEERRKRSPS